MGPRPTPTRETANDPADPPLAVTGAVGGVPADAGASADAQLAALAADSLPAPTVPAQSTPQPAPAVAAVAVPATPGADTGASPRHGRGPTSAADALAALSVEGSAAPAPTTDAGRGSAPSPPRSLRRLLRHLSHR